MGAVVLCDVVQGDYCLICMSAVLLHHLRLLSVTKTGMRPHVTSHFGYDCVVIWHQCCLLMVLKAASQSSDVVFSSYQSTLVVLILVIISDTDYYWSEKSLCEYFVKPVSIPTIMLQYRHRATWLNTTIVIFDFLVQSQHLWRAMRRFQNI